MTHLARTILFVALLTLLSVRSSADNLNMILGYRALDGAEWPLSGDHQFIAFEYDHGPEKWPVHLSIGLSVSSSSDRDAAGNIITDMNVAEITVGAKRIWKVGATSRPYLAGGVSWIWNTHFEISPIRLEYQTNDSSFGVYLAGGALWRVGKKVNLGVDVRLLRGASATFTQAEGSLDSEQIGFVIGFNWGKDRDRGE
jgi:hypothetical protein